MKLEVKIELLKFFFSFLNALFLVLGLSVGGCGIWILLGSGSFLNVLPSDELQVVAMGLLMIGAVVVLVCLVGCVGSSSESRFMLVVYCGFLIVLVLGQLFVMLLLLINRNKINQALTETVQKIIFDYGNSSDINDRMMDAMQKTGCSGRLQNWLQENILTIISMDVILILLQMIDVAMAASLYQMFGKKAALKRDDQLFDEGSDADSNLDGEQNYAFAHPDGEESELHRTNLINHQDHAVHGAGPPRGPAFRGQE